MRKILGCFIFLITMMASQISAGTVYYIDGTNGNDSNSGTELLPWQTIQKAANTIGAGDSVIVKAGTYNERVSESTNGSSSSPITYKINSSDTVICRGFTISGNYIIIDGFYIDSNTDNSTDGVGAYISGDHVIVQNCYIYQCPWGGVNCTSDSSYCKIHNNEFYYNGQFGVRISGDHHIIENNEISHTVQFHSEGGPSGPEGADADGILFFGSYHTMRENYIHDIDPKDPEQVDPHIDAFQTYDYGWGGANNCTIEKNHLVLPYAEAAWIQLEDADYLTIRNNITDCGYMAASGSESHSNSYITIVNNTILGRLNYYTSGYPTGINLYNTTDSVIKNNITVNFKSYQSSDAHHIYLYNNTNLENDYNCTYNTDGSNCPGDPGAQKHDLWKTDPKFVNLSEGDYHLRSDSPCIDAGATLSDVPDDYDGNSRPQGDGYDIGAFEHIIENPLSVNINASPTFGEIPLTVNFTGSATGGSEPYSYSWDFGDSASSSEQNPSHTYNEAGDYTVTLTVTDSEDNQDDDSVIINAIAPLIPLEASCAASPTSGEVPLTVNLTGNATGGTEPYSYSWDFGDSASSSEQNPTHTYNDPGNFTVTLTVTDSEDNQDDDSVIINAIAPLIPLEASCAASPTSGEVPLTVNFTGSATGGSEPYSYSWDFGDSASSSEQNPSHTYNEAGDYTVTLTVTDSQSNQDDDSVIINAIENKAYLSCSPRSLNFGATSLGNETSDQYVRIINTGSSTLNWNIEDDADWLSYSPSSGTDRGEITVSVNASGLLLGLYVATITVSSPEAYNSPQYVSVNLRVYEAGQESPPFGYFDTPVDGSTVSGSIPITGWALDDIEVVRLEIKRNSDPADPFQPIGPDGLIYIGDAVFVEGARPDVEKSYPDYPLNSRAGWGYMLLTNDLPYRGNGYFTIYSFAYDASGHKEEIGRKTILCDNANSIKPFGTIDTPEQGESIRGSDYINFGWALTPIPKTIPKDGSTIWVWVDGVQVGHPVYDQYREDIATLYPEYNNAQGAVGYYYLDTTQYENGVHTIAWSVMDNEGNVDGIGSRYFSIDNVETGSVLHGSLGLSNIHREDPEGRLRIGIKEVKREYRPQVDSDREIDKKSIFKIKIEEMEPVRLVLEESSGGNMEYIGWGENEWKPLPIGSTLDRDKGIFSWIPTPGFIGRHVIHFAVIDGSYMSEPVRVEVNVIPKRDRNKYVTK